jgi:hypothetical protein
MTASSTLFAELRETVKRQRVLAVKLRHAGLPSDPIGALGELYAQEVLGMTPAPPSTAGFDGWINGRTVSVKTAERLRSPGKHYAGIGKNAQGKAQDLLMVWLDEEGNVQHLGPVPFERIKYRIDKTKGWHCYFLNDVRAAANSPGTD